MNFIYISLDGGWGSHLGSSFIGVSRRLKNDVLLRSHYRRLSEAHTWYTILISYIKCITCRWPGPFLFSFSVTLAHPLTRTSYQDWRQRRSGDKFRSDDAWWLFSLSGWFVFRCVKHWARFVCLESSARDSFFANTSTIFMFYVHRAWINFMHC